MEIIVRELLKFIKKSLFPYFSGALKDIYTVLGVARDARLEVIKTTYGRAQNFTEKDNDPVGIYPPKQMQTNLLKI